MDKIEKIRAEVERLKRITERRIDNNSYTINDIGLDDDERKRVHKLQDDKLTHLTGGFCMCDKILSFIDSLPKESVSEAQSREQEIIKAADAYIKERGYYTGQLDVAFIEGAEWADEHPIKEPTTYVLDEEANNNCVNIRNSFVRAKNETDIFQGWGRIEKAKK